jgi:hypothetical protein
MTAQQWEFCRLVLTSTREKRDTCTGLTYDCSVCYCGPTGPVTRQLAEHSENKQVNPFSAAMGSLGAAGWELVSVQHGISVFVPDASMGSSNAAKSGHLRWNNVVAWFKRPVRHGRPVDEPRLLDVK